MKKNIVIKLLLISLLPAGAALVYILQSFPWSVENIYSKGIYRKVSQSLSTFTGFVPFSISEVIVVLFYIAILYFLIHTIVKIMQSKSGRLHMAGRFIINMLSLSGAIYFAFLILWGMNYHRLPFSTIASLDVSPASVDELYDVCEKIVYKANELRSKVVEDKQGYMDIPGGFKDVSGRAYMGYIKASEQYPELGGNYGRPKPVLLSVAMSYAGITGIYFPFTGEANVNIAQPDSMLPATACHEMAHQRGFAREDEANYISYYACSLHPDYDFQYSGTLLALINSMNALYSHDKERYKLLCARYSDGVRRDLQQNDEFWSRYEGPVEKISDRINDTYLKSNMQKDGVFSYGRMVDLLIDEYRKTGKI